MKKIAYAIILSFIILQNLLLSALAASANQGIGTNFDSVGSPYGGCGVPAAQIDSQNYVALNVINTPGNYADFSSLGLTRPIPAKYAYLIGAWNNGLNCGRWITVTIGNFCTGANSGTPGSGGFCPGAQWITDKFNGSTLNMVVADSCTDGNEFCRDSFYHTDLHTLSLGEFVNNGVLMPNLITAGAWNNREISWSFISAPNYQGDIKIGLAQNSQQYWADIIITNLQNGIHGVDVLVNGKWQAATMNSDMGQSYILPSGATEPFTIRVYNATGTLINNGRTYTFSIPSSCNPHCSLAYTAITYTTR